MSEICKNLRLARQLTAFRAEVALCAALLASAGGCTEGTAATDPTTANGGSATAAGSTGNLAGAGSGSMSFGGSGGNANQAGDTTSTNAGNGGTAGADEASVGGVTSGGAGAAPLACNTAHAKGVAQLSLMSGGVLRKVRLFVPSAYDGQTRLPLVLNLHGSTDNADNFATSSQMEQVAESEGFAVAGLEAVAGQWNVPPADDLPDDVAYAAGAIDLVASALCIDLTRVYASGFSGGGRMSSRLGCLLSDKITAIGPVAGVRFPAPCPGRPVPVITIHGLADTTNAYAGEGPAHPRWDESVEQAVLGWATKNGCSPTRQVDDPPGPLSTYTYGECQKNATVELVRMDGVEHAYPTGSPLHAAKKIWSFVKAYQRD
jgi:polyhydroxybutyrate depolymerase